MAPQAELSPQVDRDLESYRAPSAWGPVALLLGIISAVAVIGPLLWILPATAAIVSIVALWRIRASDGQLVGRGMAVLGLALAIFFGMAGPARTLSREYWLDTRADRFAHGFVELLENGMKYEAHQLTKPAVGRKPLAEGEEPYAKDADSKKNYETFLKLDAVKALMDEGTKAKVELTAAKLVGSDDREDIFVVSYKISPREAGGAPLTGQIYLARTLAYGTSNEEWQVIPPAMREAE
jgi:hypothetical protein